MLGPLVLLSGLILMGCAETKAADPIIQIERVYPSISPSLLFCPNEPKPGDIVTDIDLADWAESLRMAGRGCREKLDTIRKMVETWPH